MAQVASLTARRRTPNYRRSQLTGGHMGRELHAVSILLGTATVGGAFAGVPWPTLWQT